MSAADLIGAIGEGAIGGIFRRRLSLHSLSHVAARFDDDLRQLAPKLLLQSRHRFGAEGIGVATKCIENLLPAFCAVGE